MGAIYNTGRQKKVQDETIQNLIGFTKIKFLIFTDFLRLYTPIWNS